MPTPQPLGPEILVSVPPDDMQTRPEFYALNDGGFVAVYASSKASGSDIRGQIFDADGQKVDGEFVINTTDTGYHTMPAVAVLSNGRFVVTWNSLGVQGEQFNRVRARIFDENGTADAGEFYPKVEWPWSNATSPSVTALGNGGFAVAYAEQYGHLPRIEMTFYDADGHADRTVRDLTVNDPASALTSTPSIAALSDGSVVAVYVNQDHDGTGRSDNEVRGRIVTAEGATSAEFAIPDVTAGTQIDPTVTALSGNRFVVVWTHWNAQGSSFPYSIKARIFHRRRLNPEQRDRNRGRRHRYRRRELSCGFRPA
jgi:hypothetical protein